MTDNRLDALIVYDIETISPKGRRRWRRICQLCKDYGQRVQFSVFECRLTQAQLEAVESKALDIIDEEKDTLRIYVLHGGRETSLRSYGIDRYQDFDGPLVL
jgi:CRISPR-associated protein Cas2